MKDCGMIKDLLPLYIDGVCSEESRQLVEEHMKECDTCRMLATKMKSELTLPMEDGTKVRSFRRFFRKSVEPRCGDRHYFCSALAGRQLGGYRKMVRGMAENDSGRN